MSRHQLPSLAIVGMVALVASLSASAQELCPNGGFENGNKGWTLVLGGYGALGADWTKAGMHAVISAKDVHGGKAEARASTRIGPRRSGTASPGGRRRAGQGKSGRP